MQQVQNFGEPFFLVIHEGETLEEIKSRIQKKLHVPDEDFAKVCKSLLTLIVIISTGMLTFFFVINGGNIGLLLIRFFYPLYVTQWKFASFSMGRPDYLQDTEVVYDRFQVESDFLTLLIAQKKIR